KVGMTTLPAGPGGGDSRTVGSGFGISKACDDPQAAFEAITVMTGPEALTALAKEGRALPSRVAEQAAWFTTASEITGAEETLEYYNTNAQATIGSDKANQFSSLLIRYGPAALNGQQPAREAFAEIAQQLG
ncbi:MAG: ABC transporter substrate-binding protein, partial [Dermatophilaceae bacterium]